MGGYLSLPSAMVATPEGERWARRALDHVLAMPAKAQK